MNPFRSLITSVICIVVTAFAVTADAAEPAPRVRTADPVLVSSIETAMRRSAFFRELLAEIAASDVYVYVEMATLPTNLVGRMTFIGASEGVRFVRIQVDRRVAGPLMAATLGHEFCHAAEVARARTVVDEASVLRLYQTIGFGSDIYASQYESDAAVNAGVRVRRESMVRLEGH